MTIAGLRSHLHHLWRGNEHFRFLVVGAANTVVGYLLFTAVFLAVGRWLHYVAVALIAQAIAVVIAFVSQRSLVFRRSGPWLGDFLRYNVSVTGTLLFGLLLLSLLVEIGGIHPLLAQAIVIVISVIATYLLHKTFSFRRKSEPPAPSP